MRTLNVNTIQGPVRIWGRISIGTLIILCSCSVYYPYCPPVVCKRGRFEHVWGFQGGFMRGMEGRRDAFFGKLCQGKTWGVSTDKFRFVVPGESEVSGRKQQLPSIVFLTSCSPSFELHLLRAASLAASGPRSRWCAARTGLTGNFLPGRWALGTLLPWLRGWSPKDWPECWTSESYPAHRGCGHTAGY